MNASPINSGVPAWTHGGKPVPFVSDFGNAAPARTPEAIIPVERIRGPLFLVAGGSDLLWPSADYTAAIVSRLKANGKSNPTSLVYPSAGHGVGAALPHLPLATVVKSQRYGTLPLGGSVPADSRARADSWPKLLRFLEQARR